MAEELAGLPEGWTIEYFRDGAQFCIKNGGAQYMGDIHAYQGHWELRLLGIETRAQALAMMAAALRAEGAGE